MCLYLLFVLMITCSIEVFRKGGLVDGYSLYDVFYPKIISIWIK
jgi:hypothetical protein